MPIVFIHGVNTRKEEPGYAAREQLILRFLKDHIVGAKIGGAAVTALPTSFPYWGDLGITFAWGMASVPPMSGGQALGISDDAVGALVATIHDQLGQLTGAEEPLTAVAKRSFSDAVEMLSAIVLESSSSGPADAAEAADAASFVADIQAYASKHSAPPWVNGVTTDAQLISQLIAEITPTTTVNTMGNPLSTIGGWLTKAARKVKDAVKGAVTAGVDRVGDFASTRILASARRPLNATIGTFFGDVFVYMDKRGTRDAPGEIPKRILGGIKSLPQFGKEPLVVIGHSLGGVISYDLFTHFDPSLSVDLFVSVGSQVSHFEEIKRFKVSDPKVPANGTKLVPRPASVKRWINIYDPVDIFAYRCAPVFDKVEDYDYDTKTFTIKAHGAYVDQQRFYERLRSKI